MRPNARLVRQTLTVNRRGLEGPRRVSNRGNAGLIGPTGQIARFNFEKTSWVGEASPVPCKGNPAGALPGVDPHRRGGAVDGGGL